ncbi:MULTISPECIES: filamentous hemagglutinin N-terminal domain-containing protein [unclassified Nostoc]|uniref:two-partner secretion domain-containing protein n=1 Tax=unclassified Nostoc TaxID=2593658 RepID=UPI002ADD2414|nr:filamentous hemagglutinin N-terminal domain-containing protein [Nostoc sp. DedQUE02]
MSQWHLNLWLLMCSVFWILDCVRPSAAQVIPDNTLPPGERSQVSGNLNFQIDGGAKRGGNLFHSFQSLSVPTGGSAYFNNGADVQNIFSRVTGGSISNIDGVIRANGAANLFLLNPNGIIFGANASLNIGGSFVATTANSIRLANGDMFSTNPGQPLPSQVLNINPNALFFNQLAAQPIINRSTANNSTGLQVSPGRSLLLVGGDVQLESGKIVSPGSRVELGAVAGEGAVGLSRTAGDWRLSFPDGIARADVSLSNSAFIDVRAGDGGSIAITARNLTLNQGSRLRVGIKEGLGFADAQAGNIELNATETINTDGSYIGNEVRPGGTGNTGDINITTGSLSLTNGAQVASYTSGQGDAGSVNINARSTVSLDGNNTAVFNRVYSTGIGNVGDINITTGSFSLTGNALLYSNTSGQGNTGSVNINARDTVFLDGIQTAVLNSVNPTGIGNAGDINIITGSLSLTGNAELISATSGGGNTGGVNINARDTVSLDDSSYIFNIVYPTGNGNSGGINISTKSLSFTRGASLFSYTRGQGNAGNVNINARDRVSLDGASSDGVFASTILTDAISGSVGQGGNVTITTGSLFLTNGGAVNTATNGAIRKEEDANKPSVGATGNAGRVTINARDSVEISGTAPTRTDLLSGVFTSVEEGTVGSGGDVIITTRSLFVSDQGKINTRTQGQGNAGNIQIQATDAVSFNGGNAISTLDPGGVGTGGNIDITARSLSLLNGSQLAASTAGSGNAGNITVSADAVDLSGGQLLTTTSSSGRAGDITINTPDLQLSGATSGLFADTTSAADAGNLTIQPRGNGQSVRVNLQDGAQVSASTKANGQGGTLTITAPESITLTGDGSIIAAGTAGGGQGGDLKLQTGTLSIQNQAKVTVSSSGTGSAGSLFVDANRIYLNNQGSIRADTTGGGGNIFLRTPLLLLRNGSAITTNATGENIPGGNISIDAKNGFIVAVSQENSDISANSLDFRGGNVTINAQGIFGTKFQKTPTGASDITATGVIPQFNGTVQVNTPDVDPNNGLVELPANFVDRSSLIAQGCLANKGNSFTITGRGGLPPLPTQALATNQTATVDWVTLNPQEQKSTTVGENLYLSRSLGRKSPQLEVKQISPTIVEATSWVINKSGAVELTASVPIATQTNAVASAIVSSGASLRDATRTPITACPSQTTAIQK